MDLKIQVLCTENHDWDCELNEEHLSHVCVPRCHFLNKTAYREQYNCIGSVMHEGIHMQQPYTFVRVTLMVLSTSI